MTERADETASPVTRRAALASLGAAITSAGCMRRVESTLGRSRPDSVSLSIKTVPADADERATRVARHLSDHLGAVGIDATVTPLAREELWREVLLNQNFDLYVGRLPALSDPAALEGLLDSRYTTESGWQNPFGYTNLTLDDQLAALRTTTGAERRKHAHTVLETVAREQPFTPVALPEPIRVSRDDRVDDWAAGTLTDPVGFFSLDPATTTDAVTPSMSSGVENDSAGSTATPSTTTDAQPTSVQKGGIRGSLSDSRPTENLNPLTVEFRTGGFVTDLVYDRLGRSVDGSLVPWLATEWEWLERGETPVARLRLRPDLTWHDGEPLTAEDVAFTYRFLQDTSLGRLDSPIPAPRFRSQVARVADTRVITSREVDVRFEGCRPETAVRAFDIPPLPKHVWESRTGRASIAGIDAGRPVTDALVTQLTEPVGSGPFVASEVTYKQSVELSAFADHPLVDADESESEAGETEGESLPRVDVDHLSLVAVPSPEAAVSLLESDDADLTASPVRPEQVSTVGHHPELSLHTGRSRSSYHVGYNCRRSPLSSARFRRLIARLLDRPFAVDDFFDGYARPIRSPLAGTEWLPDSLAWSGSGSNLSFFGANGRLNRERAREAFRDAGYRYTTDGELVVG